MVTTEYVKKLAGLARIRVENSELEKFTSEFDQIISYISQLEKLDLPKGNEMKPALRNVMREDGEPHATGIYTDKIVAQFPDSKNNALSVKQIISHE